MQPSVRDQHVARVRRDGFTVVENAIAPALIDGLSGALSRLERELDAKPSANGFEGRNTVRIYNLPAHGAVFAAIPTHDAVLPIVGGVLDPASLISSLSSTPLHPGECPQPIYANNMLIPLEKPHRPIVCNSMWA